MQTSASEEPLTPEDIYLFRNTKIIHTILPAALRVVVQWVTADKDPNMCYSQYLTDVRKLSNSKMKSIICRLSAACKRSLETHNSCDTFDVSLLLALIKASCNNLADFKDPVWETEDYTRLECLLSWTGKLRNNVQHGDHLSISPSFGDKVRLVGTQLLRVCGRQSSFPDLTVEQAITKFNAELDVVQNIAVSPTEVSNIGLMKRLVKDGNEEVKHALHSICVINPVIISRDPCKIIPISSVFYPLKLRTEGLEPFDCRELLNTNKWSCNDHQSSIKLIVGAAGSGKTTILKMIGKTFYEGQADNRQLMLYIECRDVNLDSLRVFLTGNFRRLATEVSSTDLMQAVLGLRLLFLVDGVDELNNDSRKLLREILRLLPKVNAKLICTSRPEAEDKFERLLPAGCDYGKFCVENVQSEEQPDFLLKYFEQMTMRHKNKTNWSTEHFLDTFGKVPRNMYYHYRSPINLVLFCHLYVHDAKDIINLTTPVSVYEQTLTMYKKKILEREDMAQTTKNLGEKTNRVIDTVCVEALRALGRGEVWINEESYQNIQDTCIKQNLDSEQILSGLLLMERAPYDGAIKHYSFFHKEFQEFLAAKELVARLTVREHPVNCSNKFEILKAKLGFQRKEIQQILYEVTADSNMDLTKYRNLLQLSLCILQRHDALAPQLLDELASLLRRAGVEKFTDWCRLVTAADCQPNVAKRVAREVPTTSWNLTELELRPASVLQQFRSPAQLYVDVTEPIDPNIDGLNDILSGLSDHTCELNLVLWHSHNTAQPGGEHLLAKLKGDRCQLKKFIGSVSDGSVLARHRRHLKWANIALSCPGTHGLEDLGETTILRVVILYGAPPPSTYTPLPLVPRKGGGTGLFLELRNVPAGETEWVFNTVTKLTPRDNWFRGLEIKNCYLTLDDVQRLDENLRKEGVRVRGDFELTKTHIKFDHRTETKYVRFSIRETVSFQDLLHDSTLACDTWCVNADDLHQASHLLLCNCPESLQVFIDGSLGPHWKNLKKFLQVIRDCNCDLQLHFTATFDTCSEPCDELLDVLTGGQCKLTALTCCLLEGRALHSQGSLIWLRAALTNPALHQLYGLQFLRYLNIAVECCHSTSNPNPPVLPRPLPRVVGFTDLGRGTWFELRRVGEKDEDWALGMLLGLAPDHERDSGGKWYRVAELTNCSLSVLQLRRLQAELKEAGVTIRGYYEQTGTDIRTDPTTGLRYISLFNR